MGLLPLLFFPVSIGFGGLFGRDKPMCLSQFHCCARHLLTALMHCSHTICPTYALLRNQQLSIVASSLCVIPRSPVKFGPWASSRCSWRRCGLAAAHRTPSWRPVHAPSLATWLPSLPNNPSLPCSAAPLFLSGDVRSMTERRAEGAE